MTVRKVAVFWFFAILAGSQAFSGDFSAYYQFENTVMSEVYTEQELETLYANAKVSLLMAEPKELREFFLARTEFFRSFACARDVLQEYNALVLAAYPKKPPKLKIPDQVTGQILLYIDKALVLCEKSLSIRPTANAYMGKGLIVLTKGMFSDALSFLIAIFQFTDLSKTAYKMEPENLEAALMNGVIKAMPAAPFGNPKEGIIELHRLLERTCADTPSLDLFIAYFALAQGYLNLKQKSEALYWFEQAAALYPKSGFLPVFEKRIMELPSKKN